MSGKTKRLVRIPAQPSLTRAEPLAELDKGLAPPRTIRVSESPLLTFVVPGRPPNLANGRLHWAARNRLVQRRKDLVWAHVMALTPRARPPATGKRRARAVIFGAGRPFDPDNATANLKADLDALVLAGLLLADSPDEVELTVEQTRAPGRRGQEVVWILTEAGEAL